MASLLPLRLRMASSLFARVTVERSPIALPPESLTVPSLMFVPPV